MEKRVPTKLYRIHNLDDESHYYAAKIGDARDNTDRSALAEAMRSGETITMGIIIVEQVREERL